MIHQLWYYCINRKLLATSDKTKQTTARNGHDRVVYLYLYVEVNLCSKYSSLLIGGYLKRCPIFKGMRYNNRPKKRNIQILLEEDLGGFASLQQLSMHVTIISGLGQTKKATWYMKETCIKYIYNWWIFFPFMYHQSLNFKVVRAPPRLSMVVSV